MSRENILLAYRNIKANTGSKTKGTDGMTISDYKIKDESEFLNEIRATLEDYKPDSIRRLKIPKIGGKTRPLGIPTMKDRLIQQMYDIGVKDRRVLRIVGKMLKAPIKGEGVPKKGTPQGGILSPLLSNIVLNELDWWIGDQWESFKTRYKYKHQRSKLLQLKSRSNLKEMYIVRYADDFKIFTRSHQTAVRIYHAVKDYLRNNLKLEISTEKSQITDLRKKPSNFLGFKIKAVKRRNSYVANTFVADEKVEKIKTRLRELIRGIQKNSNAHTVTKYNIYVMGIKNYYKYATHINADFGKIAYQISKALFNRLKSIGKYEIPSNPNETYRKFNMNRYRTYKVDGVCLHPVADVQTNHIMNYTQDICNYTEKGRQLVGFIGI